jgi:hypothetical protein
MYMRHKWRRNHTRLNDLHKLHESSEFFCFLNFRKYIVCCEASFYPFYYTNNISSLRKMEVGQEERYFVVTAKLQMHSKSA